MESSDKYSPNKELLKAAKRCDIKGIRDALLGGADVNAVDREVDRDRSTALMLASGASEIVGFLMDSGADINAQNSKGYTALMCSVEKASIWALRKLIDAGCDVRLRSNNGGTALVMAASRGFWRSVRSLLAGDPGTDDINDAALAAHAIFNRECLLPLVEAGADIEINDVAGISILSSARNFGWDDIISCWEAKKLKAAKRDKESSAGLGL